MCIVFLVDFSLCAVVIGVVECPCRTVFVERGIQGAVGRECCELPISVESDGGTETL